MLRLPFVLSIIASVLLHSYASPQQPNADLDKTIKDIFSQNPAIPVQSTGTGFGRVVTPEPVDGSQPQIEFNSISGKAPCNCVPYHMCDPTTGSETTPVEDGEFDGFGLIDLRFGADDPVCEHFLDVCCGSQNQHRGSLTPKPQEERPNRSKGCGIRNVGGIDFNITGAVDNEAGFGEFPWTVALLHANNYSYFCSGSLIHPQVVLTAVHCVVGRKESGILVRAGEWDSQTIKERLPYQERNVQRIITHPNYNYRNVANNFALVVLTQAVVLADHINVVCLPGQNAAPLANVQCFANGWGKDVFGEAGRFSAIMKRVPLPIVDFGSCQTRLRGTRLGPKFVLNRSFICAGGERGIDTCQGDGGAPLVCPIGLSAENRYEQDGIVSWGIGCNDDVPAVYASVSTARDWIDQQMLSLGYGTTSYSVL
ncbi:phenoloxidase-activating factor 2 [Bactrocera oleae]|uniref:phenoloxidase-activating factor 2 n=1 Tax=Bactrocera oleae TaxID=104688 RepID=UPI00387E9FF7